METVNHPLGFRECDRNNLAHRIGKVKGHFLNVHAFLLVYQPQHLYHVFRFCTGNDRYQTSFTRMPVTVGDKRVQLTIGKGGLVYGKVRPYVFGKQQP